MISTRAPTDRNPNLQYSKPDIYNLAPLFSMSNDFSQTQYTLEHVREYKMDKSDQTRPTSFNVTSSILILLHHWRNPKTQNFHSLHIPVQHSEVRVFLQRQQSIALFRYQLQNQQWLAHFEQTNRRQRLHTEKSRPKYQHIFKRAVARKHFL